MLSTRHPNFRGFLTERLTLAAVEIFGEVESIVEAYYEENKRLKSILHMVLSPEIKLNRIDESLYPGVTTVVRDQHHQQNTRVDLEISEPKEEPIEYDISLETACVKEEPVAEPLSTVCISDQIIIKVEEFKSETAESPSADEGNDASDTDSQSEYVLTDDSELSTEEEESLGELKESHPVMKSVHKKSAATLKRSKRPWQKTMLELPRGMAQKYPIDDLPDTRAFIATVTEAYKDIPDDMKPLITTLGLAENVKLVDCALGRVPRGSPLSYQCPVPSSQDYKKHDDAPPQPLLPLSYHNLKPKHDVPTLTAKEQEHMDSLHISKASAASLEVCTRPPQGGQQIEEQRRLRLTSHFREICKLKPGRSNAQQLICKIHKGPFRCKMAQIFEEMKTEGLREYCRNLYVNWYPCGLVVHPSAPWLGAVPCGVVYDPKERLSFGLVHVKCVNDQSFIECKFLVCQDRGLQLKKSHSLFWHIQGEMMITGMSWCDLLVISREDVLIQRIYRDMAFIDTMKGMLDAFFFEYYLPSLCN